MKECSVPATTNRRPRKWKPTRERINPVTVTLRFDDDDGEDAAAGFAFAEYLRCYRAGDMAQALKHLAALQRLVNRLLLATAEEAKLFAGLTWEQIGHATGTSGQAAWQKWRRGDSTRDPVGTINPRAKREHDRAQAELRHPTDHP